MQINIALAQMNPTLGDLAGNAGPDHRPGATGRHRRSGNPAHSGTGAVRLSAGRPGLAPGFLRRECATLDLLASQLPAELAVIVGHPLHDDGGYFNAASLLRGGRIEAVYRKQKLPNHSVFDEQRTFVAGEAACVFDCAGMRFGINICADIWEPGTATQAHDAGAQALLVLNASPFHVNKLGERLDVARQRVAETGLPLVYVNMVGGQDELVFDGASFALDADGVVCAQYPRFRCRPAFRHARQRAAGGRHACAAGT
jgi:NAD+ synthase (glutamine-hydrolysing)